MWTTDKETKERTWKPDKPPMLTGVTVSGQINAGGRVYHVTYKKGGEIARLVCGHDGSTPEIYCKAWEIAQRLNPFKGGVDD